MRPGEEISLALEVEGGKGRKERGGTKGKSRVGGEVSRQRGQSGGTEDSEQCRGGAWTRTVTEEEAGHLRVRVKAVKVVFVL